MEMARDLIRLSGKEPGVDIEIAYTGLRPGEKLYEELITEGEGIFPTEHEKIMVIKSNGYWNGLGNRVAFQRWLREGLGELYYLADQHYSRAIREKLADLVPEYKPQDAECIL
jgi:FlaA1/EpsC-like NDP-sugar epimerase